MKLALSFAMAVALATPALAQDHSAHAGHAAPAAAAGAVEGVGVIRGVDAKAGTVTIAHEPIKALKWGAMTMPFKVSDAALLKQAKVGAKVRFQLKGQQIVGIKAF